MFCLHGVALDSVGRNSLLPEATSLAERFRIAIVEKPVLSAFAHTDQATTSKASFWSSVGVVIAEGMIQAASQRDISSVMLADGKRQTEAQSATAMKDALDKITASDARYPDYPLDNELVIANPGAAGIYFKDTAGLMPYQINEQHVTATPNTVPPLIRALATEVGLPVFAVRTTGMYQVREWDTETGKYLFSAETAPRIHPSDIVSG